MEPKLEFDSGWVPPRAVHGAEVREFVWRGEVRRAYLCRHPSGLELVDVRRPGRRVRGVRRRRLEVKVWVGAALILILLLLLVGCGERTIGAVSATDSRVAGLVAEARRVCGMELGWDVAQALAVGLSPARGVVIGAAREVCARYRAGAG